LYPALCATAVSQHELEGLYKRFRSLDRGRKGYISAEEFLAIPELSINPLAQRLVRLFEAVNYKEFVKLLAPFSPRAPRDEKVAAMFRVYDVDGDGESAACMPGAWGQQLYMRRQVQADNFTL
jgi:Ca2+-binding EF-hand superfamily protein